MLQETNKIIEMQRPFLHQEFVQIRHQKKQVYLADTNTENKYGLILGAQSTLAPNTIFILEKFCPQFSIFKTPNYSNTPIIQGDLLRIRSFLSNYYVTCVPNEKSPVTKQGLMVLAQLNEAKYKGGEQVFILQNMSNQSTCMRLVNVETLHALHSHSSKLKDLNQYNEVTAFRGRDENDAWTIEFITKEMREAIHQQIEPNPLPRKGQNIRSSDSIIIRNAFTGGTLHSHSSQYKYGNKQQEVTWKAIPRDLNDWWKIYNVTEPKAGSDKQAQFIQNNSAISLLHIQTKQFLNHQSGCKVKSDDYFQICCSKAQQEFIIELIDIDDQSNCLTTEKPFRIMHKSTLQFVAALERPSSQSTSQGEIVLTSKYDWNAVWMIEYVDSIYA